LKKQGERGDQAIHLLDLPVEDLQQLD